MSKKIEKLKNKLKKQKELKKKFKAQVKELKKQKKELTCDNIKVKADNAALRLENYKLEDDVTLLTSELDLLLTPISEKDIKSITFADNKTTVIWSDGSTTSVQCSENDTFDSETGFAMCLAKKCIGNRNIGRLYRKCSEKIIS